MLQRALLAARLRLPSLAEAAPQSAQFAQLRLFSDDGDKAAPAAGDAPAEAAPPAAAAAAHDAPPAADGEAAPPAEAALPDLMAQGYSARQAAYIRRDPEKHKHFLPRLSRRERGGYSDPGVAEQFGREVELYPQVPSDKPIYNLREVVPEMDRPRSALFARLQAARAADPAADLRDLAAAVGLQLPPAGPAPAAPGAEPILEWNMRLVLSPGIAGEAHPANKKVRCRVALRALQRQAGLTDEAARHVAVVAGPRYDARTGYLTLTCARYEAREDNRSHVVRVLQDLVQEGRRAFPAQEEGAQRAA
jgi:hypothetical protein